MSRKTAISAIVPSILILLLCSSAGVPDEKEVIYGHAIPPFHGVLVKVFKSCLTALSLDQLQNLSAKLADPERFALADVLGPDRGQIKSGLAKDKQDFLDQKFPAPAKAPASDLRKVYPHFLALAGNGLAPESWSKLLDSLSAEELASQNFWLETEGRRVLYSELTLDRTKLYIDHIQDWQMLEEGKRQDRRIRDYSCILYKQERIKGKLQGVEKILLKYRKQPRAVYLFWLEGPWKDREVLYNEKIYKPGWARVRESGALGVIPVTVPITYEILQRGTNHSMAELGFTYFIEKNEADFLRAKGRLEQKRWGILELGGRKVYKMETILPRDPAQGFYCYRLVHYIDFLKAVEIKAEVYDWDNQLRESFFYAELKLNPGLSEKDFDPENPDYHLK